MAMSIRNQQDARALLGRFGLESQMHLIPVGSLSGGQKARVVLASIVAQRPHLLVLDEPTNHLDVESIDALIDAVAEYQGGVILVSHDARLIRATKCVLWLMDGDDTTPSVRVYTAGFEHYRTRVLTQIEMRQRRVEREAQATADARATQRRSRMSRRTRAALAAAGGARGIAAKAARAKASVVEEAADEEVAALFKGRKGNRGGGGKGKGGRGANVKGNG